ARTIGTLNKGAYGGIHGNIGYTGLEGSCEKYLKGKEGVGYRQNLSGRWVSRTEIEPIDGQDVTTTIDIRYQDVVESALEKQLRTSNAEWGTAILMEVKTGEIKAVANLGRTATGVYEENYNYAFGAAGCYEPGSTFKLVSLLIALDHGVIDTSDVFDTGNGVWKYKGRTIYDSDYRYGGHGLMTVKQIFEKSSNVGFAKMILEHYEKKPHEYTDRLRNLGITKPLGIELNGEGKPYFKSPGDSDWWGTSLAWMSYGYEMKMTPAQTLCIYNAVANDGKMVRPHLIKSISDRGQIVKKMKTEVINPMIVSQETVKKAQALLESVCENGTGKSVQGKTFKIAGKTGTAQIASSQGGYGKGLYLASFAGYFPAENPEYSMIVVVNRPQGAYYGGAVAGPVFKEISERVFALYTKNDENKSDDEPEEVVEPAKLPDIKSGFASDLSRVLDRFKIDAQIPKSSQAIAKVETSENRIIVKEYNTEADKVPDVRGMAPSDAVYLLENSGLNVRVSGVGKVKTQSLTPGTNYKQGQSITIILG
ncbi:MAG: transpeptidase family protein, partial [Prolixibacteraceae bacterium]|nr:transpeptidase family protein [Prolixibacteraceae bacterium]